MKFIILFFLSMFFVFNATAAETKSGFDVVTETIIPLENNVYVRLVDPTKNCTFVGVTKEEQRTDLGLIDRLMHGDKKYSLEINRFNCDQTVYSIKPVHIELDRSIDAGQKIRLPYIDEVRGASEEKTN